MSERKDSADVRQPCPRSRKRGLCSSCRGPRSRVREVYGACQVPVRAPSERRPERDDGTRSARGDIVEESGPGTRLSGMCSAGWAHQAEGLRVAVCVTGKRKTLFGLGCRRTAAYVCSMSSG